MSSNPWRQLDERHVASEVELMVWSNKMDLLAISNVKGEVVLHRLSWQKVWVLPPHHEGAIVVSMVWRPDGKVLAIGYTDGDLVLTDVENKDVLYTVRIEGEITCMHWMEEATQSAASTPSCAAHHDEPVMQDKHELFSPAKNFLPKLPSLSRPYGSDNEESLEDNKKPKETVNLNILIIGTDIGRVVLSLFGMMSIAVVDITTHITEFHCCVKAVNLSEDLRTLYVAVACTSKKDPSKAKKETLVVVAIQTDILGSHSKELCELALKHRHVTNLMIYLSHTMQSISEAWENILLEMDSKLVSYASKVPENSVSADFLELLMFGTPSAELEHFLLQDLTEKGLKKLGHSIESSYSNIQKLVLKQLQAVMHELTYILAEMMGMSRYVSRYGILGLQEDSVQLALSAAGSFILKATEVQQVIDTSMKNYKAFFRWLYVAILRLTEERVVSDITKMNQQELAFIAEFLYSFDSVASKQNEAGSPGATSKPRFNLEKLGQYLVDQDLLIPQDASDISWPVFLEKNPALASHPSIIMHLKNSSLVQVHKYLTNSLTAAFSLPERAVSQYLKVSGVTYCSGVEFNCVSPLLAISDKESKLQLAFLEIGANAEGFYFLEMPNISPPESVKCSFLYFASKENDNSMEEAAATIPLKVLDMEFYLKDTLSILVDQNHDNRSAMFIQFPVASIKGNVIATEEVPEEVLDTRSLRLDAITHTEATALLEPGAVRTIENMVAFKLAVSGTRKVAVILSESRHKVRLFEMEAEEEEEEDEAGESIQATTFSEIADD